MASLREALGIQRGDGEPWWRRAACRGQQFEIFFFDPGSRRSEGNDILESRAQRICAGCPVRRACLEEALTSETPRRTLPRTPTLGASDRIDHALPAGMFGGQTPEARWAADVAHLEDCQGRGCVGCRPIRDRIDMLEDRFKARSHRYLTRREHVVVQARTTG